MMLDHHQQTKNLLMPCSPKRLGSFRTQEKGA